MPNIGRYCCTHQSKVWFDLKKYEAQVMAHYSEVSSWPITQFWNLFSTAHLGTYVLFPNLLIVSPLSPTSVCLPARLDFPCISANKYLKPPTQILFFFQIQLSICKNWKSECLLCFNESWDAWACQRQASSQILVCWTAATHPNSSPKYN